MPKYQPRVVRFSLDLDVDQKNFLRTFASRNEISASLVLRAMIYELQTNVDFANRIIDLIFYSPEIEVEEEEGEDIDNLTQSK